MSDERVRHLPEATTEEVDDLTFDRLVREGLLIAESVVVMRVKNRIIMRVLAENGEADTATVESYVDEASESVIAEMQESAKRLKKIIVEAKHAHVDARFRDSEFGPKDVDTLELRRGTEIALAAEFMSLSVEPEFRDRVIERARLAAMDDMFRSRLAAQIPIDVKRRDPDYRYRQLNDLNKQLKRDVAVSERQRKRSSLVEKLRFWRRNG